MKTDSSVVFTVCQLQLEEFTKWEDVEQVGCESRINTGAADWSSVLQNVYVLRSFDFVQWNFQKVSSAEDQIIFAASEIKVQKSFCLSENTFVTQKTGLVIHPNKKDNCTPL